MIRYLHLINGQPAYFCPRSKQIVYAGRQSASRPTDLRNSLYQIKADQRETRITRAEYHPETGITYSHIRVRIVS